MSTETGVDVKAVQEDSSGGDTCQAEDYFGAGCESPNDQCQEGNLDSLVVASPQGEVNGQGMDDQVPATQQSAMEEDCPATQRNGDSPVVARWPDAIASTMSAICHQLMMSPCPIHWKVSKRPCVQ